MDSPNQSVLACMVRLDLLVSIESFHHRWPENEAKPYFYTCRLQGQTGLILSSSWRMLKYLSSCICPNGSFSYCRIVFWGLSCYVIPSHLHGAYLPRDGRLQQRSPGKTQFVHSPLCHLTLSRKSKRGCTSEDA